MELIQFFKAFDIEISKKHLIEEEDIKFTDEIEIHIGNTVLYEKYFIVNNTLHELYFGQVVIFWIKYNEAPAELYLIQNITLRSKYNKCTYYLF